MKISNVKSTRLSFDAKSKPTRKAEVGARSGGNVVEISNLSSEISGLVQELANSSPQQQMDQIRDQLARGQYEVDTKMLAERLIQHPVIASALGVG